MPAQDKHTGLTVDRVRDLLSYNPATGVFTRLRAKGPFAKGASAGHRDKAGYVQIMVDGRSYMAHRLAWLVVRGRWPTELIDHINGIRDDNRLVNLREATNTMNLQNVRAAHSDNLSGTLGAHWDKRTQKFIAKIAVCGKTLNLGRYSTSEEAHQAYLTAKRLLHAGNTL